MTEKFARKDGGALMEKSSILELVKREKCAVIGIGVSNRPLVEYLLGVGSRVRAYDKKTREALGEIAEELEAKGAELSCGEGYLDSLCEKVIFRSPGIRPDIEPFLRAKAAGAVVVSEMELFFELCPTEIYAITGSDGKTTSTTLTHLFLSEEKRRGSSDEGRVFLGGNIGNPLLPEVKSMTEKDISVLELSSFQLMGGACAPDAAAITNVTPNHLNWHVDMEEYVSAKRAIVGERTKRVVLNADNAITSSLDFGEREYIYFSSKKTGYDEVVPENSKKYNARALFLRDGIITYSDGASETPILCASDIKLPGMHNVENYMTAIGLTYGRVALEVYRSTAKNFGGVEHRLELVAEISGVKYYNSSIDSSPTRTAAALSALVEKPIVICGGSDKNLDYAPLAEALCKRAEAVILNGESAKKIKAALDACPSFAQSGLRVYECEKLGGAVDIAFEIAKEGDVVLLSPASASFDQFDNFMVRGRFFKNAVLSHKEEN